MLSTVMTLGVNTLAFFIISKILPGFNIKNEKTAFLIAVAYSFLMFVAGFLVVPLTAIVAIFLAMVAFVPVIGPLLAGAGMLVTVFILTFCVSAILLIVIDKAMDDFEMTSPVVAFIASFLLAVLSVLIRMVVGA
ncbi:MAG: hypothetical protein Kow0029_25140 [Candidatus Rifleibacteriota bacterium]